MLDDFSADWGRRSVRLSLPLTDCAASIRRSMQQDQLEIHLFETWKFKFVQTTFFYRSVCGISSDSGRPTDSRALAGRQDTEWAKVVPRCGDKETTRELRSAIRLATKQARSDVGNGARLRNKWRERQRKTSISREDERARTKLVTGGTCGPTVCRGDVATIWGQVSDIQAEFKRLFAWLQTLDGQWRLSNCSQARCNKTNLSTSFHLLPLRALFTALPSSNNNTIDSLFYLLLPDANVRCFTCFVHVSHLLVRSLSLLLFSYKTKGTFITPTFLLFHEIPSPKCAASRVRVLRDSSSRKSKDGSSPLLAGSYYAWGEFQRPWS